MERKGRIRLAFLPLSLAILAPWRFISPRPPLRPGPWSGRSGGVRRPLRNRPNHPGMAPSMSMHDLIRQLKESNKTKIVLLVADGLGGLPIEPGGKTELETAKTPNLDRLASRGHRRPEHAGRARDHAGLGPGAPRPVRLRPARERHRPGGAGGARDRRRGRPEGRGDPGQLLHDRRRRPRHRPPGRAGSRPRSARSSSTSSGPG